MTRETAPTAPTAPTALTKTTLFQAGEGGYATFRIPAIAVTAAGTALAFCSARRGRGGDWDRNDIVLRRSPDGGETWTPAEVVATHDTDVVDNPAPIATAAGPVHFLYQEGYARVYHSRSEDEGATWCPPVEITAALDAFRPEYDWKVVAPGPGHGLELVRGPHAGRLVVPIWLCRPDPGIPGGDHRPSCVATIFSDDAGATWQRGAIVAGTAGPILHPSEHSAAQLADGRVMLNIRSESEPHRRLVSTSPDGATGWSPPAFDDALYEPVCFGSLLDLRHQAPEGGPPAGPGPDAPGDLLLFSNPDSHHRPEDIRPALRFRSRENLTVKLSRDGGRTWGVERVIEPGVAGYSDLAEGPDGTLYCLFEGGAVGGQMTRNGYVACARFGLSWLTALEEPVGSRGREPRIVPFRGWRDERPGEIRSQGLVNHSAGARGLNSVVLRFQPGARVELHFHNVEEQVTVIEGEALAIIDGQRHVLHPYDTTFVPAGVPHHFLNESDAPMAIHCTYGATYVEQTFPATGEVRRHGRLPGPPAVT